MSVNLHLSIRVAGYSPGRGEAIKQAIQAIIQRESIDNDLPPLKESVEGQTPILVTRSNPDYPVIVSSSYTWIPEIQAALSQAAEAANGSPCKVEFEAVDADEGEDECDDAEDDE
jgi:hypothetical protein